MARGGSNLHEDIDELCCPTGNAFKGSFQEERTYERGKVLVAPQKFAFHVTILDSGCQVLPFPVGGERIDYQRRGRPRAHGSTPDGMAWNSNRDSECVTWTDRRSP